MRYALALVAVALVAAGSIWWSRRGEARDKPADAALRVEVKRQDLAIEVVDTGKVQPKERVEIKSKVAGQVARVLVEEGQRVSKGALLLALDPVDFERDVERAAADVAQAKNMLELATLELERKQRGERDHAVAKIEVDFAANNLATRRISVRSAEIGLATAQDRLRSTRIVTPMDGTILELGIKAGEVVTPGVQQTFEGRPLLTIGDLTALIVRSELNQIDVARIRLGQTVKLTFDALPGKSFEARVSKIAPAAVKARGKEIEVFPVEATLLAPDAAVMPGMTADVRFQIEVKQGVFAVPIEAVVEKEGKSFVSRVVRVEGEEKTERVQVELGARNDRQLEVVRGVTEGETLVIDPASSKENEVAL